MGAPLVYRRVLDFIRERPNVELTVTEIGHNTGLNNGQVNQGIRTLRIQGSLIDTVKPGYSYIYREQRPTNEVSEKRIFEEIGTTKAGAIVIQDEDGNLYKAEEI